MPSRCRTASHAGRERLGGPSLPQGPTRRWRRLGWPPFTKPPAIHMLKTVGLWSCPSPYMNGKMTFLALGAKCGCRVELDSLAQGMVTRNQAGGRQRAKVSVTTQLELPSQGNSRLNVSFWIHGLVNVYKLWRVQNNLAKGGYCFSFSAGFNCFCGHLF